MSRGADRCAILWLIPLAWAVDTALKPNAETTKVTWAIDNPTFAAFARVFQETDMLNWYVSSFITSLLTALTVVVTGSMAAFALSRMRFRYKNFVFWFILIGIMIPGQVLIVPHFREFDIMNLLNTYWAVILPQAPTAIAVFIFKQFFDGLPRDLDEPRAGRRRELLPAVPHGRHAARSSRRLPPWRSSPSSPPGTTSCGRCWC